MRLLINASNIRVGGGIQNAISILNELKKNNNNRDFYFAVVSRNVLAQLDIESFPANFKFFNADMPKHIFSLRFWRLRLKLNMIIKNFNIDVVFSVFGPTIWTPKIPHLMGYAIPHYIYPEYYSISKFSKIDRFIIYIKKIYHRYYLIKNSKFYYVETEDAKYRFTKFINTNNNNIFVVNNYYNQYFDNINKSQIKNYLLPASEFSYRFITVSAYYPHKNLEVLNKVIPILLSRFISVEFVVTLPDEVYNKIFNKTAKKYICNYGPVSIKICPILYSECDALFLPSTLEVFSASYLEAMVSQIPILTSNYSFASDVCKNAALYFDPLNPIDIANKIEVLISNSNLRDKLVENGKLRLKDFKNSTERAAIYLNLCKTIYN